MGKFRIPNSEFEDTPLLTRGLLHFGIRIWACSVFFRASRVRGNIGNIGNTANNANNANIANRWDKWDKWDIWNEWNNRNTRPGFGLGSFAFIRIVNC